MNSRERLDVYRQLFLLNGSFTLIIQLLDELAGNAIFSRRDLRELQGLTQEVQLEINPVLLNPLESTEMSDWTQFGKVRKALEKNLRVDRKRHK
jgi:hypothetical protein